MSEVFALELEGVSYSYPDGHAALDDVSFNVSPGELCGIIGPNGAGKTTLLLSICGLLEFQGHIKIFGQELNKNNSEDLRKKLGLLFQDPNDQLFMPRVYDDVAFGPRNLGWPEDEIKAKVTDILGNLELDGFEDRSGHHLSMGEKKRAALATVLVMRPEILIFDEPTSNLDPQGRREIIKLIRQGSGTRIMVSHDLDMILKLTEKVILVHHGKKIAEGETRKILSDEKLMLDHGLEVPAGL